MKKILLGVTGAIAAYKVCTLVRLMIREGWDVRVVATPTALAFVGEVVWHTLTQRPVERDGLGPIYPPRHIELATWCDCFVVAPATANTLAKLAHGIGDNLLTQTALACDRPLLLAPSMNAKMWAHPATQANLTTLMGRGAHLLDPGVGELACGVTGTGRLPEPEEILAVMKDLVREM